MPYYAGDYYLGDPGLFSRFSFKKLGRFVGKAAKVVAPIAGLLPIPGLGAVTGLIGAGKQLAGRVRGEIAPWVGLGEAVFGGRRAVAGATPGAVAQASAIMRTGAVRRRRRRTRRAYRRRRRY